MSEEIPISRDDLDVEVYVNENEKVVMVEFSGFETSDEAEEYARFLAETLPLLLFETTKLQ